MKPILEIQNVSKRFRIQHNAQPYLSLRESLTSFFKKTITTSEDFYALKNVNFNVDAGQSIGIIGRNGAGKSTLLKILSKITPPSDGKIVSRGRIASLLEVGTGFHPELTGRENIFFNGSVLGMQRKEIIQKFDEIVEFSGVEKFIDTPLKHYSSGMQLRLAFSIAAHLEPEILIIDEVLAVGDAKFQKKCLAKMDDVSKSGRTILFVSHDLDIVKSLCSKAILLQDGQIEKSGNSDEVIAHYLSSGSSNASWVSRKDLKNPHFTRVDVKLGGTQPNLKLRVDFTVKCTPSMSDCFVSFDIISQTGHAIGQATPDLNPFIKPFDGEQKYATEIDINGYVPGTYYVTAWIGPHFSETYDWEKQIVEFTIVDSPQKDRNHPHASHTGFMVPDSRLIS